MMESKEAVNFYHSFPRKELQELCKRYGLSPNKTRSNLMNSLNSYFKSKSLTSISPLDSSSIHSTPLIPQLQSEAESDDIGDARKDVGVNEKGLGACASDRWETATCLSKEHNREVHSQTFRCHELECCKKGESCNEASCIEISEISRRSMYNIRKPSSLTSRKREKSGFQNVSQCNKNDFKLSVVSPKISSDGNNLAFEGGNMPQIQHRIVKYGACLADNAFASSMKSSTSVPSFEFYVRSEEGINLSVDLNLSPSDWSKRLENEVYICQSLQKNKFQSFCQELEYIGNSDKQMKNSDISGTDSDSGIDNDQVQINSSQDSIKRENGHSGFDKTDAGDGSLELSSTKPCSVATEMPIRLAEEKEAPLLSRLSTDVPNQIISDTESCPRDGETKTFCSNVLYAQVNVACNSVVKLTSDGLDSLEALEDQHLKLNDKNCGNIAPHVSCSLENPIMVYPGDSAIGSMEMQFSEVSSHQNDALCSTEINCFLDLVDTINNSETGDGGLSTSGEVNHDTCGNHTPECVEERARGNPTSWTEPSECLHFSRTLEKMSEESVSDGGHKRKRHDCESESEDGCGQRILRSAKHLVGKVLPRRSMRLVSK